MKTHDSWCSDATATEAFGQKLGQNLKGGEIIELIGDVGTGKTTFVRGLAKGIGSEDHVSSPTFTLSNVYRGRMDMHHYDLYRLDDVSLIKAQLLEVLEAPDSIVVVEWGRSVADFLPPARTRIHFQIADQEARKLSVSC